MKEIEERRAVRRYLDQPVEEEKLQQVLEAARLAPTWANKQGWKLVVVRDKAKREELGNLCDVPGSEHYPNHIGRSFANCPIVIVACADPARSGHMYGQEFYMVDAGIMMAHVMLAAREIGLGTCYVGIYDEPRVKDLLEIPANIRVVGMTPLGYPDQWPNARPRNPLAQMVYAEKWEGPVGER